MQTTTTNGNNIAVTGAGDHLPPVSQQGLWISSLSLEISAIAINLWISVSYVRYRLGVDKNVANCQTQNSAGANALRYSILAVITIPYLRFATTLYLIWVSLDVTNNEGCITATTISATAYVISVTPIYLFLWLRQRVFYSHPLLVEVAGTCVNILSWTVLVLNIGGGIAALLVILEPEMSGKSTYVVAGPRGCKEKVELQGWFQPIVYGSLLVFFQSALLGLFLYPLCHHYTTRPNEKFLMLIRKATILTSVCIMSDFIASACSFFLPLDNPQMFEYVLYDLSLAIDVMATVMSLSYWKEMLFPCCKIQSQWVRLPD